jgi:hypothetical protein
VLLRIQISAKLLAFRVKFAKEPAWKLDVKTTGLAIKQKVCSFRRHWEGGVQKYPSTNPKALWQ